ncbi:MAG TPA: DUF4870 domain-containing protein [Demequinaceae bacterium]
MRYDNEGSSDTLAAEIAQVGAIFGPLIPWLVWWRRRGTNLFAEREAATATNFGALVLVAFAIATAIRAFVPFLGFLGTVGQLAVVASSVVLCLQAYSAVRRGVSATYPLEIEVVKSHG